MSLYQLLVFLHVLAGVGIFVALGIESISLGRLQSAATPVDARVWMGLLKPGRLGPIAMLTTLVAGRNDRGMRQPRRRKACWRKIALAEYRAVPGNLDAWVVAVAIVMSPT